MLPLESVPNVSEGRDAACHRRDRGGVLEPGRDAARRALGRRPPPLGLHARRRRRRRWSTRWWRGSRRRGSGSTCAATTACIRGSVRRTSCPSCRSSPGDMARAKTAALPVARSAWGRSSRLPVFLYAESGGGRRPAFFRRGGPDELQRRVDAGELAPDFGPARLDAARRRGARRRASPLVAFNVDLETSDVEVARAIAAAVRESSGGLPGVQALGLLLRRAGRVQVSTEHRRRGRDAAPRRRGAGSRRGGGARRARLPAASSSACCPDRRWPRRPRRLWRCRRWRRIACSSCGSSIGTRPRLVAARRVDAAGAGHAHGHGLGTHSLAHDPSRAPR